MTHLSEGCSEWNAREFCNRGNEAYWYDTPKSKVLCGLSKLPVNIV